MKVNRKLADDPRDHSQAWLRRMTETAWLDVRDERDAAHGLLVRLTRVQDRQWYLALGGEVELKILLLALFYVRSQDAVQQDIFPTARWADQHSLEEPEVQQRLHDVLERMAVEDPERFYANVVRPLSEKLSEHAAPEALAWVAEWDSGFDEVDDRLSAVA
ncbi:MAG TPA: hypothetical protein VMM13_16390 [Euzebya sp.]|nr:hypothetical protein [Euzebya sp.]